jgi:hypothetical protein
MTRSHVAATRAIVCPPDCVRVTSLQLLVREKLGRQGRVERGNVQRGDEER